ncbi:hypothetical protein [Arthrobacter sp. D2-10]
MTPETCPECGAARVRNWVYDHSRANPACTIGDREDATQAADHEKFRHGWPWTPAFIRPATTAELELVGVAQPAGDEKTLVRQLAAGAHHRVIAGVDAK